MAEGVGGLLLLSARGNHLGTENGVQIAVYSLIFCCCFFIIILSGDDYLTELSTTGNMHKRTKINIAIFILLVGMACMFTAVVTDYWAVLSPRMTKVNETCEAAHFGLWRLCKKHIYISLDNFAEGKGCGPISLPGGKRKTNGQKKNIPLPSSRGAKFWICLNEYCLSVTGRCLCEIWLSWGMRRLRIEGPKAGQATEVIWHYKIHNPISISVYIIVLSCAHGTLYRCTKALLKPP